VTRARDRYDIFLSGGSQHVPLLRDLLPKLQPHGRVHLASSFLTEGEQEELRPWYDHLHHPRHHPDGYVNFNLFCIRDVNRLARAPYFIKLDADVGLRDDWIDYVDEAVLRHPGAVLFGTERGDSPIDLALTGAGVRERLGREVRVTGGWKVRGVLHVGRTEFFQRHDAFMQGVHELLYGPAPNLAGAGEPRVVRSGNHRKLRDIGDEDTLRSLVVHALGAPKLVLDAGGRIAGSEWPRALSDAGALPLRNGFL